MAMGTTGPRAAATGAGVERASRTAEVNELVLSVTASMEAEEVVFALFFAKTAASRAWIATAAYPD